MYFVEGDLMIKGRKTVGYTESANFMCLEDLESVKKMEILDALSLRYCGREQCDNGYLFGPYKRRNYIIHVVLSGKGVYTVGKDKYEVKENQAFIIYPEMETMYQADCKEPWQYAWIAFQGYDARSVVERLGFTETSPIIGINNVSVINDKVGELLDTKEITYANELKRKSIFYGILTALEEGKEEVYASKKEEKDCGNIYVTMAMKYIIDSYNKKVRVADIANKIGINRSYLTNLFKKKMQMSPQEFLINYRLEKAAQLLIDTDKPIRIIALSIGYDDSLSFSKAFKQKYQVTPSAYREDRPCLINCSEKGDYVSNFGL